MDSRYISTGSEPLPQAATQGRGSEIHKKSQPFLYRDTIAMSPEQVPLLPYPGTSIGRQNINLGERATELQEAADINRAINSSGASDRSPNHQTIDDDQVPPSRVDQRSQKLGKLLSTLHDHQKATEAHKNQIVLLKTEIESFILHSEEDQELSPGGTDVFLSVILSNIHERLILIKKYLNDPDFPEENTDYLYHLARHQLELYELPYSMFGLMLCGLKEESRFTPMLPDVNVFEKTRKTVDKILTALHSDEAMDDEKIKQFMQRQKSKVSDIITDWKSDEQPVPLPFGCAYRLYNLNQKTGFQGGFCEPSELFTRQLGFSSEDTAESVFPLFDRLVRNCVPLELQFISLLTSLDAGKGYSDQQNLYDLQAERWSLAVLEHVVSGNYLEAGAIFLEDIGSQLKILQEMAEHMSGKMTGDSSVFLERLFASRETGYPVAECYSAEAFTRPMVQAFEDWLLGGLLHFLDEVLDGPEFDQEEAARVNEIKGEISKWFFQTRCYLESDNYLEELASAVEEVSNLMKSIRKRIYVNPAHPLLDQMFETRFNQMARSFFLCQKICSSDESSPVDQLKSMFETFEKQLEVKRNDAFDMDQICKASVVNTRIDSGKTIEPWHVKFIESVLSAKKHSVTEKPCNSEQESTPKSDFLGRSLKNPSVLGKGMGELGNFVIKRFIPEPYHVTHKFDPDASREDNGFTCKVNLCCSGGEDCDNDDDDITIDWSKKVCCSAKNYLQDHDANHAPNGVLEENVGGFDHAIPTHDVLKNWYEVFKRSSAMYFSERQETRRQQQEALFELSSLAERKSSVDLDHGDFLIERLRTLWPGTGQRDQLESLKNVISKAVAHYRQCQFSQMAPGRKEPVEQLEPVQLSAEQKAFCQGLRPFFRTIIHEICSEAFRQDLTADLHSVQLMTQITGFLDIQLAGDPEPQKMYKLLGLGDKTFQTLEVYTRRLTSEHFEHKKDLLGERFYEMFSGASPLARKKTSFLSALQNHHVHEFMADVEKELKRNASSQMPQSLDGIKSVMEAVQQSYEKVLKKLKKELRTAKMEGIIPITINRDGEGRSELSPEEYHQKLQYKIKAGEAVIENLKAIIEELQLGNESLTPIARWTRVSEWIERHEASIMSTYGAAMLISIYYLAMGGTHPPHRYGSDDNPGGQLSFGSFSAQYTSVDVAQIATTTGAIFTQFGQATGWKNDVRRMLDLLEGADAFSLITSEIPTTLQSDMTNLYLSGYKPEVDREDYESTCKNGNYRPGSNRMDTVRDVCASLLTRESPLQQSHPKTDRILRVGGSTATGAAQGASFWLFSSFFSTACLPFCSWAPTIGESFKAMTTAGAVAGSVGGLTSGTRLDYISRSLNFATRVFGADRTMGGMGALIAQAIRSMRNRKDSTQMRLLVENPFKAALNICGASIPESFTKFFLHLFDGFIAQIEIGDFAEWRKAHQTLLSSAAAFNKAFEGKELSPGDLVVLKRTLGEESVAVLGLESRTDPTSRSPEYQRMLAAVVNLLGYYVMISDIYYFLYLAIRHASQAVEGRASGSTESGTTEESFPTSPAYGSSGSTLTTRPDDTSGWNSTSPATADEVACPANTGKLPQAGKGWMECWLAVYEGFRKGAPLRRFFDVALFKTLPNLGRYLEVHAHNAALGKKSSDPAMNTTLLAGLAKNSALGPLERLLQMSPEILAKCAGDVVNQMNTNIKEAMESVGQRNRDKATEALKKAARDVYWRLLENANYDLSKAESDMVKLIRYWQEDLGFQKLNAIASLREMIIQEQLKQCDANKHDFAEYKESVMEQLRDVMPSFRDKSLKVPEELLGQVQEFRGLVDQFTNDINNGKDMFRAVTPLLDALSGVDKKVVDAYIESELFKPLLDQPEHMRPLSSRSLARGMAETVVPLWGNELRRRNRHLIAV